MGYPVSDASVSGASVSSEPAGAWFFAEEKAQISKREESVWHAVLRLKLGAATHVEFALPKRRRLWALEPFAPFLEMEFLSRRKYGARLPFGNKARYARYRLVPALVEFLLCPVSLWAWMGDLPEDPALYAHEHLLAWTISHEGYVFAHLNTEELSALTASGFSFEPYEEGGNHRPAPTT